MSVTTDGGKSYTKVLFVNDSTGAIDIQVDPSNPEIVGTEKPMELMFINGIMNSPTFPPRDLWLSGFAISYYYFGYVMASMLALFTAVGRWVLRRFGVEIPAPEPMCTRPDGSACPRLRQD